MSWESLDLEADLLLLKAAATAGLQDPGKFLPCQACRCTAAAGPRPHGQPGWARLPAGRHPHTDSSDFTCNHTLLLHKPEHH